MRSSDWISDVCSSDLSRDSRRSDKPSSPVLLVRVQGVLPARSDVRRDASHQFRLVRSQKRASSVPRGSKAMVRRSGPRRRARARRIGRNHDHRPQDLKDDHMCGIAGYLNLDRASASARLVCEMAGMVAHRGPDDAGVYVDGPVALGHRRLSIIDLSSAGHQPMATSDGRYVIASNGEIYNHKSEEHTSELQSLKR